MAERYYDPDVVIDSRELADMQFAYLETAFPGWVPAPGNLDTWMAECGARLGSEVGTLVITVGAEIWRAYGNDIIRLPSIDTTSARTSSTWTLTDDAGYTIEAGTVVAIGNDVGFEVVTDALVPPGETVAEDVELVALDDFTGAVGSGLSTPVELITTTPYDVVSIVLDAPTSGGRDGESDIEYADRLARELELAAPRPILPHDCEVLARRVQGVERCAVLDNYKPGPPYDPDPENDEVPLTFTLVPINSSGEPVGTGPSAVLAQTMQELRGTNWRIFVIEPTYTTIDANIEAVAHRGFDEAAVEEQVLLSAAVFLSPANWGRPLFGEGNRWVNTTEVRHREFASALDRVEGLDYVPVLEFGIEGDPLTENVDISLAGAAPLPRPGAITASVSAP